jgi:hypothetical protein
VGGIGRSPAAVKNKKPYLKNKSSKKKKIKNAGSHGTRGASPAYPVQGPDFKVQYHQK